MEVIKKLNTQRLIYREHEHNGMLWKNKLQQDQLQISLSFKLSTFYQGTSGKRGNHSKFRKYFKMLCKCDIRKITGQN